MGKKFTFEINAFCTVNEDDWGGQPTEQQLKQVISDVLNMFRLSAEVIVTNLKKD